jgi:hypothetical protein
MNRNAIIVVGIGAAIVVVAIMLVFSLFSFASKDYAIDVDPIKDSQNLFSTARVTITNTGRLPLTNIIVNYGNNVTEKILSLSSGEKIMLSPPDKSPLKSVTATVADHGLSITKDYRTPIKIPGMMGS